jgi:hypothetical protein
MSRYKQRLWVVVLPMIVGMGVFTAWDARATTGGCLIPTLAVGEFSEDFFDALDSEAGGFAEDESLCKRQCADYREGCKKVAKRSFECAKAATRSLSNALREACRELSESESRRECRAEVDEEEDFILDILNEEKSFARDLCDLAYEECRVDCELYDLK